MKKLYYLIVLALILGLVLTGCSLLSNVGQVPTSEQSGVSYLTKGEGTEADPEVIDLIAGQNTTVGTVSVWNGINEALGVECLYVKYEITEPGWVMTETHLAVATNLNDPDGIPQTKKHNPIPGKFPYKHEDLDFVMDDEYIIPLSEIDEEVGCEDTFYIAAQASLQNLNNPDELVGTVTVNAINPSATYSLFDLESGKMYQLKASGTASANPTMPIVFDAEYSSSRGGMWLDAVPGLNANVLDLSVDGEFIYWGAYNSDHIYYWDMTGKDSCVALLIDDTFYPNNSGFLTVDIYLYQEETAWADGERFTLKGNWATYFTYNIQNLLPAISSDDLAGPFTAGEFGYFTVKTVNPSCGQEYPSVLFNYTIWDANLSDIASFEYPYFDGTDWIWVGMPMEDDTFGNVIGYFGDKSLGFLMPVPYNVETKFRIKITNHGEYPVTITLNDLDNSNAVLVTLTEDVVVNPVPSP